MIVLISMKRWNQMWEGSRIYLRFSFISPWPTISWPTEPMTNPFLPWKPLGTISTGLTSKSLRQWVRPTSFHESLVMQGCPKTQNTKKPLKMLMTLFIPFFMIVMTPPRQQTIVDTSLAEEEGRNISLRCRVSGLTSTSSLSLSSSPTSTKTFIMFVVVIITKFSTHLHHHSCGLGLYQGVGHGVRYRIEHGVGHGAGHGVGHGVRHGVGYEAGHGVGHGAGHGAGHGEKPPSSGLFCASTSNPPAAFIYHHQQHSWVLKHQHDSSVYICVLSTANKANLGF